MKFSKNFKINDRFICFVLLIGCMLLLISNNLIKPILNEGMTNEEPLYYNKDTYEHNVYFPPSQESKISAEETAEYYKNLNPYSNNELMPKDSPVLPTTIAIPEINTIPNNSNNSNNGGQASGGGGSPRNSISPGDEHLYMLKSQVVPPVCPACPTYRPSNDSGNNKKCPPCPPCARCPESKFECKKVINYRNMKTDELPSYYPRV